MSIVKCRICEYKTILALGFVERFVPDKEPYEADKIEICGRDEIVTIEGVQIGIYWCEKCEKISDIWVESPGRAEKKPAKDIEAG